VDVRGTVHQDARVIHPEVQQRLEEVRRLARAHRVVRLDLFGSAASDRFDPRRSDLDLLVEFEPMPPIELADAYFELRSALSDLFGRAVDLVVAGSIENPYLLRSVEESRTLLYAA